MNIKDVNETQLIWRSLKNTLWCLLGCSIGDFGTILYFQLTSTPWPVLMIMILAIVNGLITSVILETIVLMHQLKLQEAIKTALGMSFISMIGMEVSMNAVDWIIVGEAKLLWWVVPIMFVAGLVTSWPYNHWRLKKFNLACH